MFKNADLSFACSSPSSPFLRNPRRSFVMEHNPCMLSKSVCVLNEEPPSTSSPSNHFGLNPRRNVKEPQRARRASLIGPFMQLGGPGRRFSVRSGSLSVRPALEGRVKHTTNPVSLAHKHTQSRTADTILLSETWRRLCFLQLKCVEEERFTSAYPFFFLLLFHHPFTAQGRAH